MNMPSLIEILERTQTGEYCTEKEWDVKRIPKAVREKLKKYRLENSFDPNNPVNTDESLADTFFKAGYELALELCMLCATTERVIRVSEEELSNSLKFAPSEVFVGEGKDGTWLRSRTPSDPEPMKFEGSLAITMSEDIWPLITEGIAREREVDILKSGSLITIMGRELPAGSPFETLACYEQGRMHMEIRRKAGRPGMAGVGCSSSVTEYGQFGGYGIPGSYPNTDLSLILFPSELKINYSTLHKVIHTLNVGGLIISGSTAMIGGMGGPVEGAALTCIACTLLMYPILHSHLGAANIYDIHYLSNVNRKGIFGLSITQQAINRNTHLIAHALVNQVSGPCTENLLLESLVGMTTISASGAALCEGPRSAGGKLTDYITPLECRFCAEVGHRAAGLSLHKVNEIAKEVIPRYENSIKDPDIGKPFQEVYDLKTLKPTKEWEDIYKKVKKEAINLGVPLDEY